MVKFYSCLEICFCSPPSAPLLPNLDLFRSWPFVSAHSPGCSFGHAGMGPPFQAPPHLSQIHLCCYLSSPIPPPMIFLVTLWKVPCPLKMTLFLWLVFCNKNLTWEVLQQRGWSGPGHGSLCLMAKPTIICFSTAPSPLSFGLNSPFTMVFLT